MQQRLDQPSSDGSDGSWWFNSTARLTETLLGWLQRRLQPPVVVECDGRCDEYVTDSIMEDAQHAAAGSGDLQQSPSYYAQPLNSDVIGVIAEFLNPTTKAQRPLMLVSHMWYQGVVQQDGMRPKPGINWPWDAIKKRQPQSLRMHADGTPSDLLALDAVLPRVECLIFLQCYHITQDTNLLQVPLMANVRRLEMCNCGLDDKAVKVIAAHATQLEHLDIGWNRRSITDTALQHIGHHAANLQHLGCSGLELISHLGVACLAQLPLLATLEMNSCEITDVAVEAAVGIAQLTSLNLSQCPNLTDECAKHFASMKQLCELCCFKNISNASLEGFSCATTLTKLEVYSSGRVAIDDVELLARLQHLQHFVCKQYRPMEGPLVDSSTERCWEQLSKCSALRTIDVSTWAATSAACWMPLSKLKHLTSLQISSRTPMMEPRVMLEHFSLLPDITELQVDFSSGTLHDVDLEPLANFTAKFALKTFRIYPCTNLTDGSLVHLRHLQALTDLDIAYALITDDGLAFITTHFAELQELSVFGCSHVTEPGVVKAQRGKHVNILSGAF